MITQRIVCQKWSGFHVVLIMVFCKIIFSSVSYDASTQKSAPDIFSETLHLILNSYGFKCLSYQSF